MSSQELLEEFKRQQMASQIGGAFQKLGQGVGTQMPYMQAPQAGGGVTYGQQAGAPAGGPNLAPTGGLFQGMGGPVAAGGIDQQQLAAILQRLGYGSGGSIQ
jgi:hypothetical protein